MIYDAADTLSKLNLGAVEADKILEVICRKVGVNLDQGSTVDENPEFKEAIKR